ncbi:MAG: dethiobiotin synthase [Actinomycetota bacterium]|nr:dethiobiotin synthase [Actinomycetota bacterium]
MTATGTGVGKTFVGAALAALLGERGVDVGVMKPAETGVTDPYAPRYSADAALLAAAAGVDDPPDLVVPYRLREPLAPAVAAELEGREISAEAVLSAYAELRRRHEFLVVEGAGGIAVPFNEALDMAGLARALGLPLLVVSPTGLGAINGCVLTVEYARICGLEILGILLNLRQKVSDTAESTNPDVVARLTGLPVYGPLDLLTPGRDTELSGSQAATQAVRRACPELVEALVSAAESAG